MASVLGRELTMIVPGLFGPDPPQGADHRAARRNLVEGLDLGALESLLSRAHREPLLHEFLTPEDLCFGVSGYRRAMGADWPVAAVTRYADTGEKSPGWYLRADPVHLKADMSDLVLFDGDFFDLGLDEARVLAKDIAGHFKPAGWHLEVHHPLRWCLRLEDPPQIQTTPLSTVRSRPVAAHLPTGHDADHWRACLNETQMVLHQCEFNEARAARGEAGVNSLWFWGGGVLPEPVPAVHMNTVADSPLARGLSALSGTACRGLPDDGVAAILRDPASESCVAVVDRGFGPARASDVEGWQRFMVDIERDWFKPVKSALETGGLTSLNIITNCPIRFAVGPPRWWQRLQRTRSFADLALT